MPRNRFQTLTEQMFYVLLCLDTERSGVEILDAVKAMTDGRVSVGSGTLYNLLEQFVYAGFICETRSEGRRRSYVLTELGRETLWGGEDMRDIKRRMEYYPSYDRSGIAAHLEAMAAKGLILERITSSFWYYRRSEPQELHYAVTYDADASAFDPVPDEAKSEFYELCAHEGWEFVTAFAEMQIFANRRKHPTPLETDPVVELEAIERSS